MSLWIPGRPYWSPEFPQWHDLVDGIAVGGACHTHADVVAVARAFDVIVDCRDWTRPDELDTPGEVVSVPTDDDGAEKGEEWFGPGVAGILQAVADGKRVLVHCSEGVNRGPSMAYAALLCLGYSSKAAWALVARRSVCEHGIAYADDADHWFDTEYLTGKSVASKILS